MDIEEEIFVEVIDPSSGKIIGVPTDTENKLQIATLEHSFPGAYGLKYETRSGAIRTLLLDSTKESFLPPKGGWERKKFTLIYRESDPWSFGSVLSLNRQKVEGSLSVSDVYSKDSTATLTLSCKASEKDARLSEGKTFSNSSNFTDKSKQTKPKPSHKIQGFSPNAARSSTCSFNAPAYILCDENLENYTLISKRRNLWISNYARSLSKHNIVNGSHYSGNKASVVLMLQKFNTMYPQGGTDIDYANFENNLKKGWSFSKDVPSVVNLIESRFLEFSHGRVFIHPDVLDCKLILIEENICSNLYRYLKNSQNSKSVVNDALQLINISREELLCAVNSYPAVFDLELSDELKCSFDSAEIRLTEEVCGDLEWRVILDFPKNKKLQKA